MAVVETHSTRGAAPAVLGCSSSKCDGMCLTSLRGMAGGVCAVTLSPRASTTHTATRSLSYPPPPLPLITLDSQAGHGHLTNSPRSPPPHNSPASLVQL